MNPRPALYEPIKIIVAAVIFLVLGLVLLQMFFSTVEPGSKNLNRLMSCSVGKLFDLNIFNPLSGKACTGPPNWDATTNTCDAANHFFCNKKTGTCELDPCA